MNSPAAQLHEIFDSIQGEGPYVGFRQLFIRFAFCNLACAYCDTKLTALPPKFKLEKTPGKGDFQFFDNPVDAAQLFKIIAEHLGKKPPHHSVALTGGEPLLQVEFLKIFLPRLKTIGLPIYLETNGVLPDRLQEIIELVDVVAMDYKLPSATGLSDYAAEHKKMLSLAQCREVLVKVVITKNVKAVEIDALAKLVAEINPDTALILQPVSVAKKTEVVSGEHGLSLYAIARRHLTNVRLIPQIHKILGML